MIGLYLARRILLAAIVTFALLLLGGGIGVIPADLAMVGGLLSGFLMGAMALCCVALQLAAGFKRRSAGQ